MKLTSSLMFIACAAPAVFARTIPVGGLCSGIAGPSPYPCVSGSICCSIGPDRSLCAAVSTCPTSFIPKGGLCAGIAGPLPASREPLASSPAQITLSASKNASHAEYSFWSA